MPKSVALFEKAGYLAVLLGIASGFINYPVAMKVPGATLGMFVTTFVISISLEVLLIWLIARKRKNWARWVWIVLIGVGTALAVLLSFVHPTQQNGVAGAAAYYLTYILSIASAMYLLRPDARAWFRQTPPDQ